MTEISVQSALPLGSVGRHANGYWGMAMLVVTEAALFAYLLFSYFYIAVQNDRTWLPANPPSLGFALPNTVLLLAVGAIVWRAEGLLRAGAKKAVVSGWLFGGAVLGALFVAIQVFDWRSEDFTLSSSSYGSLYFTITGFHLVHVIVGVLILLALALWSALGYFDRQRSTAVSVGTLYWLFVDAAWLAVFLTFYITPQLSIG